MTGFPVVLGQLADNGLDEVLETRRSFAVLERQEQSDRAEFLQGARSGQVPGRAARGEARRTLGGNCSMVKRM